MNLSQNFNISSPIEFEKRALEIFRFQSTACKVYKDFLNYLNFDVKSVKSINDIPFLPIQFFKSHKVVSNTNKVEKIFLSSGTTGSQSQHFVTDLKVYEDSFRNGFADFYGNIEEYIVLALLPSYLERDGSSLIYMVDDLIKKSKNIESGFFSVSYTHLTLPTNREV